MAESVRSHMLSAVTEGQQNDDDIANANAITNTSIPCTASAHSNRVSSNSNSFVLPSTSLTSTNKINSRRGGSRQTLESPICSSTLGEFKVPTETGTRGRGRSRSTVSEQTANAVESSSTSTSARNSTNRSERKRNYEQQANSSDQSLSKFSSEASK